MALQLVKDMAISHIVQVALDTAKSCLQNGVGLFLGVQNELEKIKDFLEDIHDFIVIAERSPVKDPKLMKLLEILKDAAYDAEDLMEERAIEDQRQSVEVQNSRPVRDTITNKALKVVTSFVTPIINRAELAKKLKELSERLEAIKAKGDTFQLNEKVTNLEIEFKRQRETHSLVNESQVFGREEEKEKIVTLLLSTQLGDEGEHENVSAFAIVGMGGIGKTTLAKLVFNKKSVQNHFKLKMWICVSDNFDIIGLGNEIIQRATGHNPSLSNVEELQCCLRETLSEKRFLLVLDDVWNEEPEKWYRLRDLLICGGRASRIVITTRSQKVAFIMSKIQPHILKCLSEDDCWSLFSRRAFGNPIEEALHPNLVPIGREIVKKCEGNPLAVTTLGGLLCFERGEHKWEFVKDSEMWNLADENEHQILSALRLSYNHLKPHMKQCFAFCALFPKDYIMEKELLIKLWMANGFIPTKRGMELEDIGNEIFDELVMRSFFQDVNVNVRVQKITRNGKYWRTSKNTTTCRMHDLMHDLAQSVMKNEYCVVQRDKSVDISQRVRHVSAYGNKPLEILVAFLPKAQMLRTCLMLEDISQCNIKEDAFQFPCDIGLFRCLRALDLMRQKQEVEKQLLTSLGNLQHLRYLNLSFTSIEMLPESLTSLSYLQTLILTGCKELCQLPEKLGKLTNLRCLDIMGCSKLTHMPAKMGQLSSLQELSRFIVGRTNEIVCSGIGELQSLNLRGPLQIEFLQNITDVTDVPQGNIISKPNLTSLRLKWEYGPSHSEDLGSEEVKEIEMVEKQLLQGLQPHRNLEKLRIYNFGGIHFPSWMMDINYTKLVKVNLHRCWRCNHLPPLGQLPLLKTLKIFELNNVECIGDEFYGNDMSGGFPSLEILEIFYMKKLKTWSGLRWKGERVFPSLVKLEIWSCPMLTTMEFFPYIKDLNAYSSLGLVVAMPLYQGMMQSLISLKSLNISNCPELEFFHMGQRNLSSLESMHLRNCNLLSFADEDQIRSLSSLQELTINSCDKLISSCKGLHHLTSLHSLTIADNNEFACMAHELSLPTSLQHLCLDKCHGLKSLPKGMVNLTSLESLQISNCLEMESLPRELQWLSALENLFIHRCPTLEIRCEKNTGEDWHKIQHIPHISLS